MKNTRHILVTIDQRTLCNERAVTIGLTAENGAHVEFYKPSTESAAQYNFEQALHLAKWLKADLTVRVEGNDFTTH